QRIREAIEEQFWERVIIGFYNGAIVSTLSDGPPTASEPSEEILRLERALRSSSYFAGCTFRSNENRIAISLPRVKEPILSVPAVSVWVAQEGPLATVSPSSHSIDVTFGPAKKTAVVEAIREYAGARRDPVLRVGDKGRWPGNDAELLDDPFG